MLKFNYYTPTEIIFGENEQEQVAKLIKKYNGSKVLVVCGISFVKTSGLLDQILNILDLAAINYEVLSGIKENPLLSKVNEGIEIIKQKQLNFILAVGGGSVIDSAKAMAAGVYLKTDVWSLVGRTDINKALPIGVILTIPAAGSEMSASSVITNDQNNYKRSFSGPGLRAKFAILNPTLSYSLSSFQSACGIVDIILHTLERFFTNNESLDLTDDIAKVLIQNVFKQAPIIMSDPKNFKARAEIMWSGALSHNGLTGARSDNGDWSTHMLSHEISAKYQIAHGQALAALWGSWALYVYKHNTERFLKFAVEIMEVNPQGKSKDYVILEAINKLNDFFKSLGLKSNLKDLNLNIDKSDIMEMSLKASHNNTKKIGNIKTLSLNDIQNIYESASV